MFALLAAVVKPPSLLSNRLERRFILDSIILEIVFFLFRIDSLGSLPSVWPSPMSKSKLAPLLLRQVSEGSFCCGA